MFGTAQAKVDQLATPNACVEIRLMRQNVRLARLAKLGQHAEYLRHVQSEYNQRRVAHSPQTSIRKFSSPPTEFASTLESQKLLERVNRDGELQDISESMAQVVELLRSMQTVTIEQGSLLDRIDYNLARTQRFLHRGNQHLQKSTVRNESNKLLLLFLFMLVILLLMAHGVKRTENVHDEQDAGEVVRVEEYRGLVAECLKLRNSEHLQTIMTVTGKLLLLNPDFMTAWNIRRRALQVLLKDSADMVEAELRFSVEAIKANPKSYGAWFHRKWIIIALKSAEAPLEVAHELVLCNKLLELDSRNFHCWNYRWFLTESFNVSIQSEFDFTTLMIYRNFSNYSAWHRRSLLFPRLEDLKLIKSAYFTEPADQSCWFYLRWLLNFAAERFGGHEDQYKLELESISELLSIEPEAPLALAAWVHVARLAGLPKEEILEKSTLLAQIDPLRSALHLNN
ncbi:Geranylgeranyl transferase type-2 subunit alpha [Paramicrosporidium saccamoebae]|uniref:Geranylgeranyl transferase type-2 subunit alpha n=1 Tax=Paramicrosporidium saccamoebae TaxID=1246581 RepID=A0A2H9TJF3_9FUNG|nr:Geranylgeranyl transferase type-2 subunit alpha [Paramicrosporidium saccamoebae]